MKLETKLKERWIKALTSKKWKQGLHHLKRGSEYCCLGVLCIVEKKSWKKVYSLSITLKDYDGLPTSLAKEFFGDPKLYNGPSVSIDGNYECLAYHNDNGRTFEEIAKAIKEQL